MKVRNHGKLQSCMGIFLSLILLLSFAGVSGAATVEFNPRRGDTEPGEDFVYFGRFDHRVGSYDGPKESENGGPPSTPVLWRVMETPEGKASAMMLSHYLLESMSYQRENLLEDLLNPLLTGLLGEVGGGALNTILSPVLGVVETTLDSVVLNLLATSDVRQWMNGDGLVNVKLGGSNADEDNVNSLWSYLTPIEKAAMLPYSDYNAGLNVLGLADVDVLGLFNHLSPTLGELFTDIDTEVNKGLNLADLLDGLLGLVGGLLDGVTGLLNIDANLKETLSGLLGDIVDPFVRSLTNFNPIDGDLFSAFLEKPVDVDALSDDLGMPLSLAGDRFALLDIQLLDVLDGIDDIDLKKATFKNGGEWKYWTHNASTGALGSVVGGVLTPVTGLLGASDASSAVRPAMVLNLEKVLFKLPYSDVFGELPVHGASMRASSTVSAKATVPPGGSFENPYVLFLNGNDNSDYNLPAFVPSDPNRGMASGFISMGEMGAGQSLVDMVFICFGQDTFALAAGVMPSPDDFKITINGVEKPGAVVEVLSADQNKLLLNISSDIDLKQTDDVKLSYEVNHGALVVKYNPASPPTPPLPDGTEALWVSRDFTVEPLNVTDSRIQSTVTNNTGGTVEMIVSMDWGDWPDWDGNLLGTETPTGLDTETAMNDVALTYYIYPVDPVTRAAIASGDITEMHTMGLKRGDAATILKFGEDPKLMNGSYGIGITATIGTPPIYMMSKEDGVDVTGSEGGVVIEWTDNEDGTVEVTGTVRSNDVGGSPEGGADVTFELINTKGTPDTADDVVIDSTTVTTDGTGTIPATTFPDDGTELEGGDYIIKVTVPGYPPVIQEITVTNPTRGITVKAMDALKGAIKVTATATKDGNPDASAVVTFNLYDTDGVTLLETSPPVTATDGTASFTFSAVTKNGTYKVTASEAGFEVVGNATVEVTSIATPPPAVPTMSDVSVTTKSDGTIDASVILKTDDVGNAGVPVVFTLKQGTTTIETKQPVATDADGKAAATFTGLATGDYTVTVSSNTHGSKSVTVRVPAKTGILFDARETASGGSVVVHGTVLSSDETPAQFADVTVTLTGPNPSTAKVGEGSETTDNNGAVTITLGSNLPKGASYTVTAKVPGYADFVQVVEIAKGATAPPADPTLTVDAHESNSGGLSVSAHAVDSSGPVPGVTVTYTLKDSDGNVLDSVQKTTDENGDIPAFKIGSGLPNGSYTLTAETDPPDYTVKGLEGPITIENSDSGISVKLQEDPGGEISVTAKVGGSDGNPLSGGTVTLTLSDGDGVLYSVELQTDANGDVPPLNIPADFASGKYAVKDGNGNEIDPSSIPGKLINGDYTLKTEVDVAGFPPVVTPITIRNSNSGIAISGGENASGGLEVALSVHDEDGNPMSGVEAVLKLTDEDGNAIDGYDPITLSTDGDGNIEPTELWKDLPAGSYTVTAEVAGLPERSSVVPISGRKDDGGDEGGDGDGQRGNKHDRGCNAGAGFALLLPVLGAVIIGTRRRKQ